MERVTTRWKEAFTRCEKCYEYTVPKTWPVPAYIQNEIKASIQNQIDSDCNGSGGGINTGPSTPISFPPFSSRAVLKSQSPPNYCMEYRGSKEVICGKRCNSLTDPYDVKITYDRFGTPAPKSCRDLTIPSDSYNQKIICQGALKPKIGQKRNVIATYEITYGIEIVSGPCSGRTASVTRTFEKEFNLYEKIRIHGRGYVNYRANFNCCKKGVYAEC